MHSNTKPEFTLRWVLTHDPIALFEASARSFTDMVEQESGGRLRVKIYTPTEYGHGRRISAEEVVSKVEAGELEMSQTYVTVLGKRVERLWVLDLPFLFTDHQHAAGVLDGPIGTDLLSGLLAHGVRGLAFTYSGGYRIISSTVKAIRCIEDIAGLQVRTSDNPVVRSLFESLGATPHPAPLQAIPTMTAEQKINAAESTWPRYGDMAHFRAQPIVNETSHSLFLTALMINEQFFQQLPIDLQQIVSHAALRMARMERAKSIADGNLARAEHLAQGGQVVTLSPTERERMKHVSEKLYEKFAPVFGAELIQRIRQGNIQPIDKTISHETKVPNMAEAVV